MLTIFNSIYSTIIYKCYILYNYILNKILNRTNEFKVKHSILICTYLQNYINIYMYSVQCRVYNLLVQLTCACSYG